VYMNADQPFSQSLAEDALLERRRKEFRKQGNDLK